MSRPTWVFHGVAPGFAHGAVTLYGRPFQAAALALVHAYKESRNPGGQVRRFGLSPRSLATTSGISVDFFSSGY